MCHRWIPRGYQDSKVVPELQEDVLTEVCQSHYAPQHTEQCDCDETIDCIVDSSDGEFLILANILLITLLQPSSLLEEQILLRIKFSFLTE